MLYTKYPHGVAMPRPPPKVYIPTTLGGAACFNMACLYPVDVMFVKTANEDAWLDERPPT